MPKDNALLSSEGGEAHDIPAFNQTLTCTGFLLNGAEEHLQLTPEQVKRYIAGEDFVIALAPVRDIVRGIEMSKYHFLRASAIYRLYVHEEMKPEHV